MQSLDKYKNLHQTYHKLSRSSRHIAVGPRYLSSAEQIRIPLSPLFSLSLLLYHDQYVSDLEGQSEGRWKMAMALNILRRL